MFANKSFCFLLYLLRLADGQPADERVVLSPDEWREVYRLAKKHAVVAIAWDGVERMQTSVPDAIKSLTPDLMGKWFADAGTIEATNAYRAAMTEAVQDILHEEGFDSQLLKGAALAAYYPNPVHRQTADIDLWVLPKQAGKDSLCAHRKALIACLRQRDITIDAVVYHHIETNIAGTDVEMHVTPTWLCNPLRNRRLQQLFADAGKLTPELQELYTLLHAFRHIYHDGIALRHVMDYHLVCRHNRQVGVQQPCELYRQLGLTAFVRAMDEVSAAIFDKNKQQQLSKCAKHILEVLPERKVSRRVQWDYPAETLCVLPWRSIHFLWRKANHYV